jgi:GR25 family glycosyltransferase involved in LPS biosynthesis
MFSFFDKTYCINLDKRTDRWQQSLSEFAKVGISVERFKACEGDNKALAFNKSQYHCIQKGLSECDKFLILEDDVEFKGWSHLGMALNELPNDWDILWLGGNLIGCGGIEFRPPVRYRSHLFRPQDIWQTHAVAYSRKAAEWIVNNFPFHKDEYEKEGLTIYDEWLRVNALPMLNCFIVAPQIAVQRADHSDIWNTHADYTSLFERGNKLLQ